MTQPVNTSGFYKLNGTNLLYAPNRVTHSEYELNAKTAKTTDVSVDGWKFFSAASDAYTFYNVTPPVVQTKTKL